MSVNPAASFEGEPVPSDSPEDSLIVRLGNEEPLTTRPDRVLTLAVLLTNLGSVSRTLSLSLDLPQSWLPINTPARVRVSPNTTSVEPVAIKVPGNASAGIFQPSVNVYDSSGTRALISASATVVVSRIHEISLRVASQPDFVKEGQRYTIDFEIANLGNGLETVDLSTTGDVKGVSLDSSSITLNAGQRRIVQADVEPSTRHGRRTTRRVSIGAKARGHTQAEAFTSSAVEILPVRGEPDKRDPLDVMITLGGVGDERNARPFLAVGGRRRWENSAFEFEVRVPDNRGEGVFGRRDFYSAGYTSDRFEFSLGDQSFALSPLTTSGDYAFGAGARVRSGSVGISAFGQESRLSFLDYRLFGTSVEYRPTGTASLSFNLLRREKLYAGTIATVRGTIAALPGGTIDAECGLDRQDGPSDPACSITLSGASNAVSYRGRVVRTGDLFPGSARGLSQGSAGLDVRISQGLAVYGTYDRQQRRIRTVVNRQQESSVIGIRLTRRLSGSMFSGNLTLLTNSTEYAGGPSAIDREEYKVRLATSLQVSRFSTSASVDFGSAESESRSYSAPLLAGRLRLRASPVKNQTLSAFLQHDSGFVSSTPVELQRWLIGVEALLTLSTDTRLSGRFYRNSETNHTRRSTTSYEGRLYHEFPWHHRVTGTFRRSTMEGRSTAAFIDFTFGYSVLFGVPLPARGTDLSRISGRVYDAETNEGIEGVVISLDDRMALTDEHGRYSLIAPGEGSRYLNIHPGSLEAGYAPMIALPLEIEPRSALKFIDIPVVRSSRVLGRILLIGSRGGRDRHRTEADTHRALGIGQALLELRSGGRVFRTITNSRGSFRFGHVPPGPCSIRVLQVSIPPRHRLERDEIRLRLSPGENQTVRFDVVPAPPAVKMIDERTLKYRPGSRP